MLPGFDLKKGIRNSSSLVKSGEHKAVQHVMAFSVILVFHKD